MIRLLLVDDHEVVRMGLSALLQAESDLKVVAEAGSASEALACLQAHEVDVALVDIAMPGDNGLVLLREITKSYPQVRVVVVSMHSDESYMSEALRGGAYGYVLKGEGAASVVAAARAAMAGQRYLSAPILDRVIDGYLQTTGHQATARDDSLAVLTEREIDVLRMLSSGVPKAQVADTLFISVRTVETHRANVMRKLGLHSQAALVRYAIRSGLISAEDSAPST